VLLMVGDDDNGWWTRRVIAGCNCRVTLIG
jgi:hypothetical protein